MDNNLTISALTYAFNWSGPQGSRRTNASRGANLLDVLTVRRAAYVDSTTKLPGFRTVTRMAHFYAMVQNVGIIAPVTLDVIMSCPTDTGVGSTEILRLHDHMVNLLHGTTNTNGLALRDEVYVNGEQ